MATSSEGPKWDVWLAQTGRDSMTKIFSDSPDFMIMSGEDKNKVQVRANHGITDDMLKKMYYGLEEHLRERGVLPVMPTPVEVSQTEGGQHE